ncbi:MAG: SDR family NAD(P)-dependent oxidoreductase [Alsobacter sp.]
MDLKNRVAIITGAASGIDKEIAVPARRPGQHPVIADLNLDAAEAARPTCARGGADAFAVAMNVADEQVEAGVAAVAGQVRQDRHPRQQCHPDQYPFVDFPYADWKKLLAIHLDRAFLTTRAYLKHMYAAQYGRVIYMGSVHSHEASKLKAAYVTAKHGLLGLARVLPRRAPSTTSRPTWSAPDLCAPCSSTSRSPSRRSSSASPRRR